MPGSKRSLCFRATAKALRRLRAVLLSVRQYSVLVTTRWGNVQLGEQVFFAQFTLALRRVNPDGACQVLANELELRPVLSAFCIL
jgi:hypothetical protein